MKLSRPTLTCDRVMLATAFVVSGTLLSLVTPFFMNSLAGGENHGRMYLPLVYKARPSSWDGRLLISEVCFDPFGAEPDGEWIELYNPGSVAIDLGQYKVGDSTVRGNREGMLQFPPGSRIEGGKMVVIANRAKEFYGAYGRYPEFEMIDSMQGVIDMAKYLNWSSGDVELTDSDEVVLLNEADEVVDAVWWGFSTYASPPPVARGPEGSSIERYPPYVDTDTARDWRTRLSPDPWGVDLSMPTATPAPIATSTMTAVPEPTFTPTPTLIPTPFDKILLISEVFYHPEKNDPYGEWIEIYNPGTDPIHLEGFKIGDEETKDGYEGMLLFPSDTYIQPGQTLVIANHALTFFDNYGKRPDFEMVDSRPDVPNMIKYTAWATGPVILANSGDEVLILDALDNVVDAVSWGGSAWAFDPPAIPAVKGHSLERYPPGQDTNSSLDWRAQSDPDPGSVDLTPPAPTPTPEPTPEDTPEEEATPTDVPTPTPPPVLVINEIHAQPSFPLYGDANGDGIVDRNEDEFIEIVNASDFPVDVGGWSIATLHGVKHTFPMPSVIEAGCAVVVFGGGTPKGDFGGSLVQVADSGRLRLIDSGETVTLRDLEAAEVISYAYGMEGAGGQSLTRSPDVSGEDPLVQHSTALHSGGRLFSPGTKLDGTWFDGCQPPGQVGVREARGASLPYLLKGLLGTTIVRIIAQATLFELLR